jgi:hypothetical protein
VADLLAHHRSRDVALAVPAATSTSGTATTCVVTEVDERDTASVTAAPRAR